jgi:hypothetical protein
MVRTRDLPFTQLATALANDQTLGGRSCGTTATNLTPPHEAGVPLNAEAFRVLEPY